MQERHENEQCFLEQKTVDAVAELLQPYVTLGQQEEQLSSGMFMSEYNYEMVGNNYDDTAAVPKDDDIWYRCTACGKMIPSVPDDNLGCECGNVFIDRDCWRLVVVDMRNLEVLRRRGGSRV